MASFLDKEGIYTPGKRFAFTNVSESPFHSKWNGVEITVGPGETIEVSDVTPFPGSGMGECFAIKMTKELTDQIMFGNAKSDEVAKNQQYYRSPLGMMVGVPSARKPFEDRILQELDPTEDFTLKFLNKQKAEELIQDANRREGVPATNAPQEFAEIPKGIVVEAPKPKRTARVKKIEK